MSRSASQQHDPIIERLDVSAYTIPTDGHESDGAIEWESTTIVIADASTGPERGIGYTYAAAGAARIIRNHLAPVVVGQSAFDLPSCFDTMARTVSNIGRPGAASKAIAAVDTALWDLKARILTIQTLSRWQPHASRLTSPSLRTPLHHCLPTFVVRCRVLLRSSANRGDVL